MSQDNEMPLEPEKKKRGRPKKVRTEEELNRPKRMRGRPKKRFLDETNSEEVVTPLTDDVDPLFILPIVDVEQLNEQEDEDSSVEAENND